MKTVGCISCKCKEKTDVCIEKRNDGKCEQFCLEVKKLKCSYIIEYYFIYHHSLVDNQKIELSLELLHF